MLPSLPRVQTTTRAGAGYAGGIVSAAVDGLRVGSAIAAELTGRASALDPGAFGRVASAY